MTETQLRALVAVVDAGGFSAAATRLAMSQPAVSRAVAGLEEELGVQLLVRVPGAVSPSNVGLRVAADAREVLARMEAIRQVAGTVSGGYAGRLAVGSLPGLTARFVAPALGRLRAANPVAEVELLEVPDDAVLAALRNRSVDVGVVVRAAPDVDVLALHRSTLVAAVPDDGALSERSPIRLADLEAEPLIVAHDGFEHLVADVLRLAGLSPRTAFEVGDEGAALALVADGLGVALLPALLADAPPGGVALHPLEPPVPLTIGLGVPAGLETTPLARAFLAAAEDLAGHRAGASRS